SLTVKENKMSLLNDLRERSSSHQAARKLEAQTQLVQAEKERQALEASLDAAARAAAEPLVAGIVTAIKSAADKGHVNADVHVVPTAECRSLPLKELDRKEPRAFTGVTRGLALWMLDEQLRFEIQNRDNGKWVWRECDSSQGIFHPFKDKQDGYEE